MFVELEYEDRERLRRLVTRRIGEIEAELDVWNGGSEAFDELRAEHDLLATLLRQFEESPYDVTS